jgi:hypothetical protein
MAEPAGAVEDYVNLQRAQRWRSMPQQRVELVRKSYAQQLARSASQTIGDRHKRAELKAEIYGHLLPLLELHAKEQASSRRYYQKIVGVLGVSLALTLSAGAIALLF